MPAPNGIHQAAKSSKMSQSQWWRHLALKLIAESWGAPDKVKLNFGTSPFFDIQETVSNIYPLPVVQNNRHTLNVSVELNSRTVDRLRTDSSIRVMLYCATEDPGALHMNGVDIAFPQQIEVKVNTSSLAANFKGLKNKPGSTRPADITTFLRRLHPLQDNIVQITYALTNKKFYAVAVLVKKRSVDELTRKIKSSRVITKSSVLQEMKLKAREDEVVATSTVMSLKDPVSYIRIKLPCRSHVCSHNQCFDASSFLQLQEQAPTWTCPICSKHVGFEDLAVDQYVQEILERTPSSVDQVTIEPDGQWSFSNTSKNGSASKRKRDEDSEDYGDDDDEYDDSDDLVEISDPRVQSIKNESPATPFSLTRTPPALYLDVSAPYSASAPRTGQKRRSEVIDLTLSDDDEPPRPEKRQAYSTPNSLPDPVRNGYSIPNGTQMRAAPTDQFPGQAVRPAAPQLQSVSNVSAWGSMSPAPLSPFQLPPLPATAYPQQPLPAPAQFSQQSPSLSAQILQAGTTSAGAQAPDVGSS